MSDRVYLAYYHGGFCDDQVELICVSLSRPIVVAAIEHHKKNRDASCEFDDKATWWVKKRVMGAVTVKYPKLNAAQGGEVKK